MIAHACSRPLGRSRPRPQSAISLWAVVCLVALGACGLDSFRLDGDSGGGDHRDGSVEPGDGSVPLDDAGNPIIDAGSTTDAAPVDACIIAAEVCGDDVDNDCDGSVDEDFDLMADPRP